MHTARVDMDEDLNQLLPEPIVFLVYVRVINLRDIWVRAQAHLLDTHPYISGAEALLGEIPKWIGVRAEFRSEVLRHNAETNLNRATVACFSEGLARHNVPTLDPPLRDRCEENALS